jgi:hypothetical protein
VHDRLLGSQVSFSFGTNGLSSLTVDGQECLRNGLPNWIEGAGILRHLDGSTVGLSVSGGAWRHNSNTLTSIYTNSAAAWNIHYSVASSNMINITVGITNRGTNLIAGWGVGLLQASFPSAPAGWNAATFAEADNYNRPLSLSNAWSPDYISVVTTMDLHKPVTAYWWSSEGMTSNQANLIVSTTGLGGYGGSQPLYGINQFLSRPIPPGGCDAVNLSWRFGSTNSGDHVGSLMSDVYRAWSSDVPYRLKWSNRRPILSLFLSSSSAVRLRNPRGWLGWDTTVIPDSISATGRVYFATQLLKLATNAAARAALMDAQGIIVWDLEGWGVPRAVYNGEPDDLPPEMEVVVDSFFAALRSKGAKAGVTVRSQKVWQPIYHADAGTGHQNYDPLDIQGSLSAKISYCKSRWGCTLFYVDSNFVGSMVQPFEFFRAVALANPDVLLIPESATPLYFPFTAPYMVAPGFGGGNLVGTDTPESILAIWPQAFDVIKVNHKAPNFDALVASVRRGSILLCDAFSYAVQTNVMRIYAAAGRQGSRQ